MLILWKKVTCHDDVSSHALDESQKGSQKLVLCGLYVIK